MASVMDVQSARAAVEAGLVYAERYEDWEHEAGQAREALAFLCSALEEAREKLERVTNFKVQELVDKTEKCEHEAWALAWQLRAEAAEAALAEARCAHESFGCGCWSRGFEQGQQTIDHDACVVRESHYIAERDRLRAALEEGRADDEPPPGLAVDVGEVRARLRAALLFVRERHGEDWAEGVIEMVDAALSNPTASTEAP